MSDLRNLRILDIQHNKISTIQSTSLTPLHHLQELDLSLNKITNFTTVAEAVNNLTELSSLNLSANTISNLSNSQRLRALQSLNVLDLSYNSIGDLDLSYLYMPNLKSLMIMQNNMRAINASSFNSVPKLAMINFDKNPLNISFLLGIQLPYLTELHWSSMRPQLDDNLSIPCQVFQSLPKLQVLYIMHSKISSSKIGQIGECTNLTSLILSTSGLRVLSKGNFQKFRYLKVLYLNKCKINTIWNGTWIGLVSLHTLILERNELAFLQDKLFSPLIGLEYLDLSKNSLTYINNEAFEGLRNLKTLILKDCKIAVIKTKNFIYLGSLTFLDMQDNCISRIRKIGNELNFNKRDTKNPFINLKHLESLDMSYQNQRYKDPVSKTLFKGLQSLKKLNVQGIPSSFFINVSFTFLSNLTDFDMSETFQRSDFNSSVALIQKCNQTRYLHLDNNEITNLPEDIFTGFNLLEKLSLKKNKLRNISEKFVKPLLQLRNLDLSMNPLLCYCENYWFHNWSEFNTQVQIPFLKSYTCFGQVAYEINFINQDLSFCKNDLSSLFFSVSFVFTLLFLVISLVVVKMKWSVLYIYHMIKVWLQWKIQREKRLYMYDAYISYCSDDEDWVTEELLPHLESQDRHKYNICFKPRDFTPGIYHIDNIQAAIKNSRKTICIVSRNYLKSQWCKVEAEIACSRVFYEKEDVLLVVFLEEIPDFRLSAYHKLRKLIKQNTYINWPEEPEGNEFFWFKLRKALDAGIYEDDSMQLCVAD
ncbi:hypothetical protein GDO81_013709 [Engystomops pustulosus]|uniref:TIR domain-containing protein n=1 Tax=Engystomops pustulosus TaxID=76066 RepID=A0AAV7B500_ENGPU|nr:hypothetical protein GDO81_013709 [Engystomops pustulosus]